MRGNGIECALCAGPLPSLHLFLLLLLHHVSLSLPLPIAHPLPIPIAIPVQPEFPDSLQRPLPATLPSHARTQWALDSTYNQSTPSLRSEMGTFRFGTGPRTSLLFVGPRACPAEPNQHGICPVTNTTHRDATAAREHHPGPLSRLAPRPKCWLHRQQHCRHCFNASAITALVHEGVHPPLLGQMALTGARSHSLFCCGSCGCCCGGAAASPFRIAAYSLLGGCGNGMLSSRSRFQWFCVVLLGV